MKKLIAILCVVMMVFALGACTSKTPKNPEEFTQIMEAAGFDVEDETSDVDEFPVNVSSFLIAEGNDYDFQYCMVEDEDAAKLLFKTIKGYAEDEFRVGAVTTSVSLGNYDYYALTDDGEFFLFARIDNTMIFCATDKMYKEEVVDYAEQLGYK